MYLRKLLVYLDSGLDEASLREVRYNMLRVIMRRQHIALYEQDHGIPTGPREVIVEPNPSYL
jgi:hypothetical protein